MFDPEANLIYVGTGNGAPWPEAIRKSKGMDNLYVCSILAVNRIPEISSGITRRCLAILDFDSVQQLILADIE